MRIRSLIPALSILLAGCGLLGHEQPFVDADAQVTRARLLALCDEACEVQAHGEHCATEHYLDWCVENCRSIDGLIPDDCLAEAEAAYTCWIEAEWTCLDGSVLEAVQPRTLEEDACADVEDRYWLCA